MTTRALWLVSCDMTIESGCRRLLSHYLRRTKTLRCRDCVSLVAATTLSICCVAYLVGLMSPDHSLSHQHYRLHHEHRYHALLTGRRPTPPVANAHEDATGATSEKAAEEHRSSTVIGPGEPCQPAETLRRRQSNSDGRWYDYSKFPYLQFFVYSAFWDDRPSTEVGQPLVRVIAASTSSSAGVMTTVPVALEYKVYCRFHMADGSWLKPVSALPLALPIGYGWWLNNRMIREFIYDCPPPPSVTTSQSRRRPDAVTILLGGPINSTEDELVDDPAISACVPIEFPDKPTVKADFAACVQVAYGWLNPLALIEWLELQRLLGVEMVGIYNLSINEGPAAQVLRYYSSHGGPATGNGRGGFVDLRRSDYIADGPSQFLLHGTPAINDCIYRNMHRFKHIVVVDFDEAPRLTLNEVISELERNFTSTREYPPVNFIFANNYFFTDLQQPPTPPPAVPPRVAGSANVQGTSRVEAGQAELESRLMTLRYRQRAPLSVYGYAVKSIIDPQACVRMHNHYCWAVTPGYELRGYIEVVNETIAVNQHYKRCHLNQTECSSALKAARLDLTMDRYRDKLVANVLQRIRDIFPGQTPAEFLRNLHRYS